MIPGLDGLRAIAILLVFASHSDLLSVGWVGVQLFFVLSGYLITGILLDMKDSLPSREYFTKFYGRRFLRIFPLYYFYLALMAVVAYWLIRVDFRPNYMQIYLDQVWYAVLYIYDFFYRAPWFQPSLFLDHFWSLSVEEQFYIIWPLLLLVVPQQNLKKLFILFILLGPISRFIFYWLYASGSSLWAFREPFGLVIYSWPLSHLDAFALGAYISRFPIPRSRQQLFILAVLVLTSGYVATYITTGNIGVVSALGYDLRSSSAYQFVWAHTLLDYFFAVLLYCVVREKVFTSFLEMPWLRYLGKISYGMYVYHLPIIWFIERFSEEGILGEMTHWARVVISISATILIATLSFYLLERPILNLKGRFFSWSKAPMNREPG
jgi:peptidoglycan/LPS O-acetylase OafA/YrhL